MIVIGTDTHKRTHTCGAVNSATGELLGDKTAPAREVGFRHLLDWTLGLDDEIVWAIEDCRHVSGAFERFLIQNGQRVVRVAPRLTGQARKGQRTRGKSDSIDAVAIARAALKEGVDNLPCAYLDEAALEMKMLLDHHDDLVKARSQDQQRLRWHLHDLWPEFEIPMGALDRKCWLERISRKLAGAKQTVRVQVAREQLAAIKARCRKIERLRRQLDKATSVQAPELLHLPGCGPLTAARLIAEVAGVTRFESDAKFARIAGVAPIPVSSGNRDRHRLDRGGNRKLNAALHRIAITQMRVHLPAQVYLDKKRAEGKTKKEALRCLKRQLARKVLTLMKKPLPEVKADPSLSKKTATQNSGLCAVGLT